LYFIFNMQKIAKTAGLTLIKIAMIERLSLA
jgi:hypothetical protein